MASALLSPAETACHSPGGDSLQTWLLGAQLLCLLQKKEWERYPGSETWGPWVPIDVLSTRHCGWQGGVAGREV